MKYEKVFSFIDIEKEKMEQWGDILPFYKNIQKSVRRKKEYLLIPNKRGGTT